MTKRDIRLAAVGAALLLGSCGGSSTETSYSAFVPSPDGSWVAAVRHDHWSIGFGGDELTSSVELQRPGHTNEGHDVLTVEDIPAASNIKVRWTGPRKLAVRFDDHGVDFQAMKVQGIDIVYPERP